ncbi:MAG: cobalamin-dependent protein [Thermoleophilia bacterium]|nr:cobalamin-dependent protein [Thermoleophilia bacterium]
MTKLDSLANALVELDEETALALARQIVAAGDVPALSVLNVCQQAMRVVGERYERQEYYLEGLIVAGEIFNEVVELVQPDESQVPPEDTAGTVVLATVRGDIHDIGKNLFASSLRGFGFRVADLGVDVPPAKILAEVEQARPDVVCLSGLITVAFHSMKATAELIRQHGSDLGYAPPIVLGGGTVDEKVCRYAKGDSWSNDAAEGVRICRRFVEQARADTAH